MALGGHDGFGVELEAVDGVVSVFHRHDFAVLGGGGDFQSLRHGGGDGGEGVVAGGFDDLWHISKERALGVQGHVVGFAVHQFFRVGDGGAEGFADGLVAQAYAEDRELPGKVGDGGNRHAGVFRAAGAGGDEDRLGVHGFDFLYAIGIIADDPDVRVQAPGQLVQVVGKAVVVVDKYNHSRPPSAASMAVTMAFALLIHSWYSLAGTLSATRPAPDWMQRVPFFL